MNSDRRFNDADQTPNVRDSRFPLKGRGRDRGEALNSTEPRLTASAYAVSEAPYSQAMLCRPVLARMNSTSPTTETEHRLLDDIVAVQALLLHPLRPLNIMPPVNFSAVPEPASPSAREISIPSSFFSGGSGGT